MQNKILPLPWIQPPVSQKWGEFFKARGKLSVFVRGSFIVLEGEIVNCMFYLERGLAKYTVSCSYGDSRAVGLILPGRLFGEGPVVHGKPSGLSVTAIEDCHVYCLSREEVVKAISEMPELALEIICNVTYKLKMLLKCYSAVAFFTAEERMANFYYSLVLARDVQDDNGWYELANNLSHEQVGEIIGANRVTVCRIFNNWKKEGKAKNKNGRLYIHRDLFESLPECI